MLVLTRKLGAVTKVGEHEVRFTPTSISGGRVQILLEAPRWMRIMRSEISNSDEDASTEGESEVSEVMNGVPESHAQAEALDPNEITHLVLSRKKGESIEIDGIIVIKVLRVNRQNISVGLSAPPTVRFLREEAA